jgi:hypothetical protein
MCRIIARYVVMWSCSRNEIKQVQNKDHKKTTRSGIHIATTNDVLVINDTTELAFQNLIDFGQ